MAFSHIDRAQILVEALPYIQKYHGKTVVIKYGGNAMVSDELRHAVMSDIVLLSLVGINVVVVHGGGPEINEMLTKIGKESKFVDGLRYTDQETMDIVQQVLCGKVNKNLVATLNRMGGKALGLCGMDGGLFQAREEGRPVRPGGRDRSRSTPTRSGTSSTRAISRWCPPWPWGWTARPPTTSTPTPPPPSWRWPWGRKS